MNRWVIPIVGVALAGVLWFSLVLRRSDPAPALNSTPAEKTVAEATPSLPSLGAKPDGAVVIPAQSGAGVPNARPENWVNFEVIDGTAVAMGDLILGEPDDKTLTKGVWEMPTPLYWDSPEIPFSIDDNVPDPDRILKAINHLKEKTGVRFVPFEGQKDAVVFVNAPEHCFSVLGRMGGHQPIRIAPHCTWTAITHELMHTLGFIHEQSRYDRDQFVEIVWDRIEDRFKDQFQILPANFLGILQDSPFDYQSIMLYSPTAFSRNRNEITMRSKTPNEIRPSTEGLSERDITRVRRLFRLD